MSKTPLRRKNIRLTQRAVLLTLPRTDGDERGAVTAEYAAVLAAGTGFAGILIALLKSDFGQALLKLILKFFLHLIGIEL